MKRLAGTFVLSKSEQRVIVILALVVGAPVRYERRANHLPLHATATATPNPSPTPLEAEDE